MIDSMKERKKQEAERKAAEEITVTATNRIGEKRTWPIIGGIIPDEQAAEIEAFCNGPVEVTA